MPQPRGTETTDFSDEVSRIELELIRDGGVGDQGEYEQLGVKLIYGQDRGGWG